MMRTSLCFLLTMVACLSACSKSVTVHHTRYAVDTTLDGKTWKEDYGGTNSGVKSDELHTQQLKAIRDDALARCHTASNVQRVRGYLAPRKEAINRDTDKPEFDLTCEEIRAKKKEWEIR